MNEKVKGKLQMCHFASTIFFLKKKILISLVIVYFNGLIVDINRSNDFCI